MQRVSWGYLHATFLSRSSNLHCVQACWPYFSGSIATQKSSLQNSLSFKKLLFLYIFKSTTHTHTPRSMCSTFKLWYIGKLREHGYYREWPSKFLNSLPSFAELPIDDAKWSVLCVDKDSLQFARPFFHWIFGFSFFVGLFGRPVHRYQLFKHL